MKIASMRTMCSMLGAVLAVALSTSACFGQMLESRLAAEDRAKLAEDAFRSGDAVRGAMLFHHSSLTCIACHSVADRAQSVGPDLTKVDRKTTNVALVDSVLEPSKVIAPAYAIVAVETSDGMTVRGVVLEETAEQLVLRDATSPEKIIRLKKSDVADRQTTQQSPMPTGQINLLADRGQFLDLIRFLIDVRDGGAERAHELKQAVESLAHEFPQKPLPNRPVVQRGEMDVQGGAKFPRGVALGFAGGTVLFDADQLATVAHWRDGFVSHSQQNYFGLYWHSAGAAPQTIAVDPHPLGFRLPGGHAWTSFEPPLVSDPNTGTRFDGYQIDRNSVRLMYRVKVGDARVRVIEEVAADVRGAAFGFTRRFRFEDLPAGTHVAWLAPLGKQPQHFDAHGAAINAAPVASNSPLLGCELNGARQVLRIDAKDATWEKTELSGHDAGWRLVTQAAQPQQPLEVRLDQWTVPNAATPWNAAQLAEFSANPIALDEYTPNVAKLPLTLAVPAGPAVATAAAPARAGVNPQENVDEFPPVTAKFLRFTVLSTLDGQAPGIDELEITGADPAVSLGPKGKATASSVINGYSIHTIPHLNDGKLGNNNSWISAEGGRGWAQIEFPEPVEMRKVTWARDRTGVCRDRLTATYRIEVSNDGNQWTKVGDDRGRATPLTGPLGKPAIASPGYEMEGLSLPFPGCRPSDVAFASDGTIYLIAMTEGQIWRGKVAPFGEGNQIQWQQYAAGLYHPIGLAIVGERLFVAQKPEITELIDRDQDGNVDTFSTVATGWGLSTGWHEYCFGLAHDKQNYLWFTLNTGFFWTNPGYVNPGRWRGSVMRVSLDTGLSEVVAKGCRVPNGITVGAGEQLYFTDNQGDWIQACKLAQIIPGRFYGHPEYREDALSEGVYPDGHSSIWFPYNRMRSISGPVHDSTAGKFGPFADQMFVGDVGYGANPGLMRIALENVEGEYQGACFPFVDAQPLGCERMEFGPDHCLYVASLTSGLNRLKYVAKETPFAIESVKIRPQGAGFVVNLTRPLATDQKLSTGDVRASRYHLLYTGNYGSPNADEAPVAVTGVELSADRKSLTVSLPVETYPIGMIYELHLGDLKSDAGEAMQNKDAWYTVYRIPK